MPSTFAPKIITIPNMAFYHGIKRVVTIRPQIEATPRQRSTIYLGAAQGKGGVFLLVALKAIQVPEIAILFCHCIS